MKTWVCTLSIAAAALAALPARAETSPEPQAASPQAAVNYQDWWWDPERSGMGFNIGHQGKLLLIGWHHYDNFRRPTWLTMSGELKGNIVTGELVRSNGPMPGPSYAPGSVISRAVGIATITFTDADNAVFEYSYDGNYGSIDLRRYNYGK